MMATKTGENTTKTISLKKLGLSKYTRQVIIVPRHIAIAINIPYFFGAISSSQKPRVPKNAKDQNTTPKRKCPIPSNLPWLINTYDPSRNKTVAGAAPIININAL
jgi:hypothetical protein